LIPYEPIQAANKKEAVEEIAAYNSEFAKKNPDTLLFQKYKIDADTLSRFNVDLNLKPIDFQKMDDLFQSTQMGTEPESMEEINDDFEMKEESKTVKVGDIYLLGENRLMCGDCRSSSDIAALMDGRSADMCLTDPPYNVAYTGATQDKLTIDNDSMERETFRLFLKQVLTNMNKVMKPGGSIYIFHADSEGENFRAAMREAGFKFAQCCIWAKESFVMGRQDYQWKHEPVLYGWKLGAGHYWNSDRKQSTIWNFDKPKRSSIHPTMKPVALMAYPICNSSRPKEIVIDFFSGSGSTLMACQHTDRIGYGMEIDPKYVEATVRRFISLFRHQEVRLMRDGVTYSVEETKELLNG